VHTCPQNKPQIKDFKRKSGGIAKKTVTLQRIMRAHTRRVIEKDKKKQQNNNNQQLNNYFL